jgi:CHAT domain-containing protein
VNSIEYSQLPPLPETKAESIAIAKALNTNPDQAVYWGARASKATVQGMSLSDYKIVAFATHGLVPGDFPNLNQPALALSVNNENIANPLLTMDDIMKLKLNADLVVLSACNTASDDGKADEAFSGLARGFFYAGTRSILATEWPVETNSAKKLMETLFGNHAQDPKRSIAESLQKAQLSFLNTEYAHPFYWAPYILIGDGVR